MGLLKGINQGPESDRAQWHDRLRYLNLTDGWVDDRWLGLLIPETTNPTSTRHYRGQPTDRSPPLSTHLSLRLATADVQQHDEINFNVQCPLSKRPRTSPSHGPLGKYEAEARDRAVHLLAPSHR